MKYLLLGLFSIICVSLISCDSGPDSPRGFSFPKGDIVKGETVLIKYQCLACHQINGFDQDVGMNNSELNVHLGGMTSKVRTYAELVTSIINPSHKFAQGYPIESVAMEGKSKMTNFNDIMTVTELVDLVTFLESQYELVPYRSTGYQYYRY
jgi:hypothetical protein